MALPKRTKVVSNNLFFIIGLLGAASFFIFYLKKYMFHDKLPDFTGLPIFDYQCAIKIYELVFTYPLCHVYIYSDYIIIKYLWSKILIKYEDLQALYMNNSNELVLTQGKDPFNIILSFGDLSILKGHIEDQLNTKGITLLNIPLSD